MASKKVAVVTGSNKGIGFATVRGLCKQFDGDVYLTSRTEALGKEAIEELKKEGLNPKYHQLDITDKASIEALAKHLKDNYGGVDVLVNNAAIAYKGSSKAPFTEQAEVTISTNYYGILNTNNAIFPLLRPQARVVNVSSFVSQWTLDKMSKERKEEILAAKSLDAIEKFIKDFLDSVKAGTHKDAGFPEMAYGMSKVVVTALTRAQQVEISKDASRPGILINAADPGSVVTDMSSQRGMKTIDSGADTLIYLAMLPPNSTEPAGQILSERTVRPWGTWKVELSKE